MICYNDTTYCTYLDCADKDCPRRLSKKIELKAQAWWGKKGAPICQFAEQPDCYQEELNTKDGKEILTYLTDVCKGKYND